MGCDFFVTAAVSTPSRFAAIGDRTTVVLSPLWTIFEDGGPEASLVAESPQPDRNISRPTRAIAVTGAADARVATGARLRPSWRCAYAAGSRNRTRTVEVTRPPAITAAISWRISFPGASPSTMNGISPANVAAEDAIVGRARWRAPNWAAA